MKTYKVMHNVGKSKYIINSHDGIKKHKDGSLFYDINIFKNKTSLNNAIRTFKFFGYKEE